LKTERHREDRLWFCEYLKEWSEKDFFYLVPSDKFFIWTIRKPNSQNDRIWALSGESIEPEEHYRGTVSRAQCIGLFLCFSEKKMMWVIKEKGESWDGAYFRQKF
jgi:hypothetical protein